MSTTTIRLPEALKASVAKAAKRAGTTPHNFILEAIADKAKLADARSDFITAAEARYADIVESGKTISWLEMQQHLKLHAAGKKSMRPVAKKLAR